MKKKVETLYQPGKIKNLTQSVAKFAVEHPDVILPCIMEGDWQKFHSILAAGMPGYGDKGSCFNCGHSMEVSEYTAGLLEGILLFAMAKEVKHRATKLPFTEANMIHVPTLATTDAVRHAITRASYLGIVAQPPNVKGTGHWVITHWGWKLLRGDSIPRSARYWRGKMVDRSVETTDLTRMFKTHIDLVQRALARRKAVKSDYRVYISDYKPSEWSGFGGYAEEVVAAAPATKVYPPKPDWWVDKN